MMIILGMLGVIINKKINIPNAKDEYKLEDTIVENKEESERYSICVYYPRTPYDILNEEINCNISEYISDFKQCLSTLSENKKYNLNINFESYKFKNYISYVFNISENLGCIHDESYIYTAVYDIKENKVVKIQDFILKDEKLLDKISEYCYNELLKNDEIASFNASEFVKNGTKPIIENYEKFILNDGKFVVYFPEYQVVPYYLGMQKVFIPLESIGLTI